MGIMIDDKSLGDMYKSGKKNGYNVTRRDVIFAVLLEVFESKTAYMIAYNDSEADINHIEGIKNSPSIAYLRSIVPNNEHRTPSVEDISFEENKKELIRMLADIDDEVDKGNIEPKDAYKMKVDIRTKLNDKFGASEKEDEKRIVVVPQKFNYICPHTNRECYFPPKDECIKYYNIKIEKDTNYE